MTLENATAVTRPELEYPFKPIPAEAASASGAHLQAAGPALDGGSDHRPAGGAAGGKYRCGLQHRRQRGGAAGGASPPYQRQQPRHLQIRPPGVDILTVQHAHPVSPVCVQTSDGPATVSCPLHTLVIDKDRQVGGHQESMTSAACAARRQWLAQTGCFRFLSSTARGVQA